MYRKSSSFVVLLASLCVICNCLPMYIPAKEETWKNFVQWAEDNGIYKTPKISWSVFEYPNNITIRGLKAVEAVEPNETFISVPFSKFMNSWGALNSSIGPALHAHNEWNLQQAFSLYLIHERYNPDSFFAPYLRFLEEAPMPMSPFMSEEELANYPAILRRMTIEREVDLKTEYYSMFPDLAEEFPELFGGDKLKKVYTYENYKWANCLLGSRTFELEMWGQQTVMLIPWADLMNHRTSPPPPTITIFNEDLQALTVVAPEGFAAGSEVVCYYGLECKEDFLLWHGFADDVMPYCDQEEQRFKEMKQEIDSLKGELKEANKKLDSMEEQLKTIVTKLSVPHIDV